MLETSKAEILHGTLKVVEEPLIWKPSGQGFRLNAAVWAPDLEEDLELVCYYGKKNMGFCLLYQKYPFRRYDTGKRHKSHKTGEVFNEPHKHIWDEVWENDQAYIPKDISITGDVNERLLAFLKEENVRLECPYQGLMVE